MINLSYLQLTEQVIRTLKNTKNEKYTDELRQDYFGTIMKLFNFSKNDFFYKLYQAEIGKKYDELYSEDKEECYNFNLVLDDLKKYATKNWKGEMYG